MGKRFGILAIVVSVVIAAIGGGVVGSMLPRNLPDLLSVAELSEIRDSQIIEAVTSEQQVVLVSLGIQGVQEQSTSGRVFGFDIPGSTRTSLIVYSFNAKLGIEGSELEIEMLDDNSVLVRVPAFIFIGHHDESFRLVTETGGVMSWTTPQVDSVAMINDILDDEGHAVYLSDHDAVLREQAVEFYSGIIHGIDPGLTVEFEFAS